MRINKFIAQATGMSRRAADAALQEGRVQVNGKAPDQGQDIVSDDVVLLDGAQLTVDSIKTTILLNKPIGYVCSRDGQGSKTVYDLLPESLHHLKPVGRLDKDSSGLLLLSNDGQLAYELTHPKFQKVKVYEVTLDQPLQPAHLQMISEIGVDLDDGPSKLGLQKITKDNGRKWQVTMSEGRNRQIRRTFATLGYGIKQLHRVQFGPHTLGGITSGKFVNINV